MPRAVTQRHSAQQRRRDLTCVSRVRPAFPFKGPLAQLHTQELHSKPGGAKGAALFGVLIFCLLPLLIGPCSGLSAEISPVTSYNSPLPAAGSNGYISITSEKKKYRLRCSRAQLSSSATTSGCCQDQQLAQLFQRSDQRFKETLVPLCCVVFPDRSVFWLAMPPLKHSSLQNIYCETER